jgi:hypothetical protein
MANPYDAIVKKYNGQSTATPTSSKKTPANPYRAVVEAHQQEDHAKRVEASFAKSDKAIEEAGGEGFFSTVKRYAKELPGAAADVFSEPFKHPLNTAASVLGGALDVGPAVVNTIASLAGMRGRLPKPGETLNEFIGNTSDVQQAIRKGSEQAAAYEIGNDVARSFLGSGAASRVAGNVLGGQFTTEADNPKDRLKQAAFDAAFGLATEGGIKATRKLSEVYRREPIKIPGSNVGLEEVPAETIGAKTPAVPQESQIAYQSKKNLGKDANGEKVLAKTQVDSKTGNAIIYYDQSLDADPALKQQTLDHELGHVFDKRLNNGSNLSAELPNYSGNKPNLDNVLGDFAKQSGRTTEEITQELSNDIQTLSKGNGSNAAEQFANAVAEYRADPKAAAETAPTFSAFIEHKPIEPRFSERVTTASSMTPAPEGQPIESKVPKTRATKTKQGIISSTGLDTGKTVEGRSSFNPKSINAPEETEQLFSELSKSNNEFASQRISKGNEDIKDLARLTGLKEEDLIKAKPGSIANAETVTAARQLVLDKAQDLMNYLKGVDVSVATPDQLKEIKDHFLKLVSMQKSVAGFRTEASNVFRSLGIELQPGENATLSELGKALKEAGIASEGDVSLFSQRVAKEFNLTKGQKIAEGALSTWYAAILSGPKTTVRNILSTGSNILTELASKAANPKEWKELIPSISGLLRGLKEGIPEAKEALKGAPATSKFMETGGARPEIFTGKFKTFGTIVESVGRFLNAQDKLLSAGAREMERASLKVSSPEISKAVEEAITKSYAETTVYHGVPKGRALGALRDAAQTLRRKYPESKVIIPFVDTVANVLDRQFDYIPVFSALRLRDSVIEPQVERIAKEFNITGKADKAVIAQRLKDQQIGRLFLGTAISGAAVTLAASGKISGSGPTNASERAELQRSGWRPNSIKVGDMWVPYVYLGPLAGIFSMAGNVYDKTHYDQAPNKTLTDLMTKGMVGWAQSQLDQSFLSGVADLLDVLSGDKTPKTYFTNFAAGLTPIPAAYSQTKDMIFRQQYETQGLVEQIRQKLGLTGGAFGLDPLQPRLNAFGEPLTSDLIYGVTPSKAKGDKVDNFLISNDVVVTKPLRSTSYTIPGTDQKRELTDQEYNRYVQESGKRIYEEINSAIDSLSGLSHEEKKREIQNIVSDIRDDVREEILYQ